MTSKEYKNLEIEFTRLLSMLKTEFNKLAASLLAHYRYDELSDFSLRMSDYMKTFRDSLRYKSVSITSITCVKAVIEMFKNERQNIF